MAPAAASSCSGVRVLCSVLATVATCFRSRSRDALCSGLSAAGAPRCDSPGTAIMYQPNAPSAATAASMYKSAAIRRGRSGYAGDVGLRREAVGVELVFGQLAMRDEVAPGGIHHDRHAAGV